MSAAPALSAVALSAVPGRRVRPRAEAGAGWTWPLAAALHGAVLWAVLAGLGPARLPEPEVIEGTPLVWDGPVGAADGAPELSDAAVAPRAATEGAPAEPREVAPVPDAPDPGGARADGSAARPDTADGSAAVPVPDAALPDAALPDAAVPDVAGPDVPVPEAPAAVDPAVPVAPVPEAAPPGPAPREAVAAAPGARAPGDAAGRAAPSPAEAALPLPPPAAPPAPPRAAEAGGARMAALPPGVGAVRLGAGAAGSPGESRAVGAPQPGCQEVIGYPYDELSRGVTGAVGFRLRISDDGRVVEARMVEPSGVPAFDEAARRGIRRCRFIPALRDGVPVWGSRDYRVVFGR